MSQQVDSYTTERRTLWDRLFGSLLSRPEGDMDYQLPPDSLFAGQWNGGPGAIADIPDRLKAQIREEALLDAFNRLEASLRLLLYATTPGKEPPSAERCHQILNVWRYELEHRVNLTPDTYCGAVQRYESEMESSYTIDGRCEPGDLLRIRVPCWRMYDRIVVRGEAEILEEGEEDGAEAASADERRARRRSKAAAAAVEAPVEESPEYTAAAPAAEAPEAAPVAAFTPTEEPSPILAAFAQSSAPDEPAEPQLAGWALESAEPSDEGQASEERRDPSA
jgi:hypothetical protein